MKREKMKKMVEARKFLLPALMLFAVALIAAPIARAQSSEAVAVFELHFEKNALKLDGARAGFGQAPDYLLEPSHWLEVRLLRDGDESVLRSFKVRDPRVVFFDYVEEEGAGKNASLKGGTFFNESARLALIVPLLEGAGYASVFDENGTKLISINLRTLGEREETSAGKEIVFNPGGEGIGFGFSSEVLALAAAAILALLLAGLAVAARKR